MLVRLLALLLVATTLQACGSGRHGSVASPDTTAAGVQSSVPLVASPTPATSAASAGTPAIAGLQDLGTFVISAASSVQAENRAAASIVHLNIGDTIQFPPGMRWGPPPGVGVTLEYGLAATVSLTGKTLYLWLLRSDGGTRFAAVDDRSFRVVEPGAAFLYVNGHETSENGVAADHAVAVDAAGHLLVDPAPVASDLVVHYSTGQRLDVKRMQMFGRLPPAQSDSQGTFFFTICESESCGFTYRVGPLVAPLAGTIVCQSGSNFDLDTGAFRLQFRDTDLVNKNWPPNLPTPTPVTCGQSRSVQAGERISEGFVHFVVHAVSNTGQPLSVVVACDGTIYVGSLTVPPLTGPGRGA